jgi:cardiolipin synthase (CMP-forming)
MRIFDIGGRPGETPVVHDRILTAPNVITFVRLAFLPVFVWLVAGPRNLVAAYLTLGFIAATDWIDGYVARRWDQVTRLGQVLDPLVDRVLLATAGVTLAVTGIIPWWMIVVILARDVALLAAAYIMFRGIPPIPVTRTGKFATTCLYIGLPAFMLAAVDWAGAGVFAVIAWGYTLLGIITYYVAGVQYGKAALRLPRGRGAASG